MKRPLRNRSKKDNSHQEIHKIGSSCTGGTRRHPRFFTQEAFNLDSSSKTRKRKWFMNTVKRWGCSSSGGRSTTNETCGRCDNRVHYMPSSDGKNQWKVMSLKMGNNDNITELFRVSLENILRKADLPES
ncbi:unnamed protein product [Ambrosiozyma monospora]|uniref:Unnamed protein product n=1 Tax=Ambrosiozyma monospora TaxID=43982 RepID=A0ACB5T2C7_AMBMO|nr:unnamed protein product [Ambrosiozyma monospora]